MKAPLALTALALAASTASAATLAKDSFDYVLGTPITGQSGGTGWSGAWQSDLNANTVGDSSSTVVAGLGFGLYPTSGNALQMDIGNITDDTRAFVGRAAGNGTTGSTLFMSYLVQQTRDEGLGFGNWRKTRSSAAASRTA